MKNVEQYERVAQNRIFQLFQAGLGYRYLGEWQDRRLQDPRPNTDHDAGTAGRGNEVGMSDKPVSLTATPQGYADWQANLKGRIHTAQQRGTLAVNRELVGLYWQIGRDILARQAEQGWGQR